MFCSCFGWLQVRRHLKLVTTHGRRSHGWQPRQEQTQRTGACSILERCFHPGKRICLFIVFDVIFMQQFTQVGLQMHTCHSRCALRCCYSGVCHLRLANVAISSRPLLAAGLPTCRCLLKNVVLP